MSNEYDTDISQLIRLRESFEADEVARKAVEIASQPSRFESMLPCLLLGAVLLIAIVISLKLEKFQSENNVNFKEEFKARISLMKETHLALMWVLFFLLVRAVIDLAAALYLNSGLNLIFSGTSFYCCYLLLIKTEQRTSHLVVGCYLLLRGVVNIILSHLALGEDFWKGIATMTLAGVPNFLISYVIPVAFSVYLLRLKIKGGAH